MLPITYAFAGLDVGQPRFRPQIHRFTRYTRQLAHLLHDTKSYSISEAGCVIWSDFCRSLLHGRASPLSPDIK